jgi:outer membrane protein OmpA-like peptidoglycan-associated protein
MYKRNMAASLVAAALIAGTASAQTATTTTTTTIQQTDLPTFHVVVVGRETKAINFRPRSGSTQIDFRGSDLAPRIKGDATVRGQKGTIDIDAHMSELPPPSHFGTEYLTYVMWAITPEGKTQNLGEVQVKGDDSKIHATTNLQSFGIVITAEPYFAVSQPSNVVIAEGTPRPEGVFRDKTEGAIETVEAKYELLQRGTYLMNKNASALQRKPLPPGAPLDLAEAQNAVAIAELNGANRYAADTYAKAQTLLNQALDARARHKNGKEVQQPAREAVQTAEDARLIAVQRMDQEYRAQQRALLEQRALEEQQRAIAEQQRARDEEQRRIAAEKEKADVEAARLAAEQAKAQSDAAAAQLAQQQRDADAARLAAEQARQQAEAQAQQAQLQAQQALQQAEQAQRDAAATRERLRQQLSTVLETRETARGLIVNVSDVLFDFNKATLKPGAREKLARVAGILLAQPGIMVSAEGHTDSVGSNDYNQRLSEHRAQSVRDYLVQSGIKTNTIATVGYGKTRPVATNGTAAGRQQNRRVELVITGDVIGRTTTTTTTTTEPDVPQGR